MGGVFRSWRMVGQEEEEVNGWSIVQGIFLLSICFCTPTISHISSARCGIFSNSTCRRQSAVHAPNGYLLLAHWDGRDWKEYWEIIMDNGLTIELIMKIASKELCARCDDTCHTPRKQKGGGKK